MIKTAAQLAVMRESGRLLAQVFNMLDGFCRRRPLHPGAGQPPSKPSFVTTLKPARPASGNTTTPSPSTPRSTKWCATACPAPSEILKDGDIVNIDITLEKGGFIADSSKMYMIGAVSPKARRLVEMTFEAMWAGIRQVKPGARLGDIGHAIQQPCAGQWLQRGT